MEIKSDANPTDVLQLLRGNGKPAAFVQLVVLITISSDGLCEILRYLIGRTKRTESPIPPPPPVSKWLPLYRQHRKIQNKLFAAFHPSSEWTADELRSYSHEISKLPEEQLREGFDSATQEELEQIASPFVGQSLPNGKDSTQAYINAFDEEGPMTDADFDKLLGTPAGQFFFRVWLPCWIMYRDAPANLLRKARLGNDKALDQLLRLDKTAICDPVIAERFHKAMHGGVKRERDLILNALAGKPKGKLDKKTMKYGLSGMISQLTKESQTTITAPEITQLFDTIAQLKAGHLRDTSIPAGETFTRAISRNNTNWPMSQLH